MFRINASKVIYPNRTVLALNAGLAKAKSRSTYHPISQTVPTDKTLSLKKQAGSIERTLLAALVLGSAGAALGGRIQFGILQASIMRDRGLESLNFVDFITRPEISADYISISASALIGGLAGVGIAYLPKWLRHGDRS